MAVFGIVYALIALVAFFASGYMTYHDLRGTGAVAKGHISSHAFFVFAIGLFATMASIIVFTAA